MFKLLAIFVYQDKSNDFIKKLEILKHILFLIVHKFMF